LYRIHSILLFSWFYPRGNMTRTSGHFASVLFLFLFFFCNFCQKIIHRQ
jgi:hypothetical protein